MKPILAAITASLLIALAVPPAQAGADLYAENLAWMRQAHPHAPLADLQQVAWAAAERGVALAPGAASADAAGAGGVHVGEVWATCQDVSWFFGGNAPDCIFTDVITTGVPCFVVTAHWAAFLWFPAVLHWEAAQPMGSPGYSFLYFWTEGHLGLGPGQVPFQPHTFDGSGCLFQFHWSANDNFAFGMGDGVTRLM